MVHGTRIETMMVVAWVGLIGCNSAGAPADDGITEIQSALDFQDQADFDGDGKPDLLWHNGANGQSQIWFMNGINLRAVGDLGRGLDLADSSGWKPVAINYFNLDGSEDIVWHNGTTGATQFWFMNGTMQIGVANLDPSVNFTDSSGWKIVASRPHNLLLHNVQTGATQFWSISSDGTQRTGVSTISLSPMDLNWAIVAWSDFNLDGIPDILWHNGATGESQVWYMASNLTSRQAFGNFSGLNVADSSGWRPVQVGNLFDNVDTPDIIWHKASTGEVQAWFGAPPNGNGRTGASNFNVLASSGWNVVPH